MATVFITGANRGLGLEMVKQYAEEGDTVFAGCRRPAGAKALHALAEKHPELVSIVEVDVAEEGTLQAAAAQVRADAGTLDILYNNAGVFGDKETTTRYTEIEIDDATEVFRINVVGPMLVLKHFTPLLAEGAKVINLSSGYASISGAASGWPITYCASKAALNMVASITAAELREQGVIVVAMNPGWVATDMGGPDAPLTPEESIQGIKKVVEGLKTEDSGSFVSYDGSAERW